MIIYGSNFIVDLLGIVHNNMLEILRLTWIDLGEVWETPWGEKKHCYMIAQQIDVALWVMYRKTPLLVGISKPYLWNIMLVFTWIYLVHLKKN